MKQKLQNVQRESESQVELDILDTLTLLSVSNHWYFVAF